MSPILVGLIGQSLDVRGVDPDAVVSFLSDHGRVQLARVKSETLRSDSKIYRCIIEKNVMKEIRCMLYKIRDRASHYP